MSEEEKNEPTSALPIDIEEEMKRSYLDYAMSVIVGRALPDVRDGLKPVHRRVLYGMWGAGNRASRPYKKSARIVGDVMGRYHPHGDSAIYDTVVRMAQDFSLRSPLVDGQGNFGSLDGDNPAAMRYTEVRLTRLAEEMLRDDIDKETVDWVENYDGSEVEPQVLPAALPNLLVNGSAGIAVGMATNIPPHNLGEVIQGLLLLADRPDVEVDDLLEVIPGPDFPTAGILHGVEGIRSAYTTGRGTVKIRARATIEEDEKSGKQSIIVSEIPFQVNKSRLVESIAELVRSKRIEGITDLRDESDRDGVRVVIELRRGEVGEVVLNTLYKLTQLQTSFGINMLAIVDNRPKVLSLKDALSHYLDHRKTVVVRRTRFDLRKAEARAHILEGILKALDHLDEIIATIRASQTPAEAKVNLMEGFALSMVQAEAILEMRLQKLTGLEREKVVEEYKELMALIERLRAILDSDDLVLEEVKAELIAVGERFADERRTEIQQYSGDITIEDMIADEDMVITVTATGYVKRSPLSIYREQRRGGKGRMGMTTKEDDVVEQLYVASAHSSILVFTESGRVHRLKVWQVPELGPAARGKAIVNLLHLETSEKVVTTVAVRDLGEERNLVFCTTQGVVKKTRLADYANIRAGGIIAINIDDDDQLLRVKVTDGDHQVFLATHRGYAIRFEESQLRPMGRATRGVRGIALREGDRVVSMEVLAEEGEILTVSEGGFGKRTRLSEYRIQGRGGMGILNLRLSEKTGPVLVVRQVESEDSLVLITEAGKIMRIPVAGISTLGRTTQGVKVMGLDDGDRLVAIARVADEDEDEPLEEESEAGAEQSEDETVQ